MEQEKVTEELVRQNGNQAAAIMADYVSQSAGGSRGTVYISMVPDTLSVKDTDGNTLLTALLTVTSNLRTTVITCTSEGLGDIIANNNMCFNMLNFNFNDRLVSYTSPLLFYRGANNIFIAEAPITDAMQGVTVSPYMQISISYGIFDNEGVVTVILDKCTTFDHQLSKQTGFPLFNPNAVNVGAKCIIDGMICEYTADGYEPIDETVGVTTMSRSMGLNVDYSVLGQLFSMYYNR